MRFEYKGKEYELAELCEPNKKETFDIIAIMEVKYCIWDNYDDLVEVSKEVYDNTSDNFEKFEFVNYFYGTDYEDNVLIEMAKIYIDKKGK